MEETMSPRDIQLRIRSGEPLADVIAASGLPADRVEAFAGPILAEREHTTASALSSPVRRRGEMASARRLRQTVAESLLDRGQDIDFVTWDSWRRSDGRWIVQGTWDFDRRRQSARFLYDPKGRFSTADNDLARTLIGDLPLISGADPSTETTLGAAPRQAIVQEDLGNETTLGLPEPGTEDSVRFDLDLLYDMISTIDEDSVRIFRGLREPIPDSDHLAPEVPDQPPLVVEPATMETDPATGRAAPRHARKGRRASVPSWDEIIFGGQS